LKIFFLIFFYSLLINISHAQLDTLFWFAAPEVLEGGYGFDRPINLQILTYENTTKVIIDFPANTSITPIERNIAINSFEIINLTSLIDELECKPPNQVLNKGLRIRASQPISANYILTGSSHSFCSECNAEIFTLKGTRGLGTEFFIPFQNKYPNGSTNSFSSFDIVAIENNTMVDITPTQNLVGINANSNKTIILNKGQTYSAQSLSQLQNLRPTGSWVLSNKPISITMKDDMMAITTCQDIAGDQLFPVSSTGKEYIAIKGFLSNPDLITVVATENNTEVRFNNVTPIILNKGQSFQYDLSINAVLIESNKNIYVSQLSGTGCEASFAILPPYEFSCNNKFGFTRPNNDNFNLFIIVKSNGVNSFSLNGGNPPFSANEFVDVPNSAGAYKYIRKNLSIAQLPLNKNHIISNATSSFMLGFISGRDAAGGSRFAYFSDFNRFSLTRARASKTVLCFGEDLLLVGSTSTTIPQDAYWTGPNGFYSTQLNPTIQNVNSSHQGHYVFHTPGSDCGSGMDSILINIKPRFNIPQFTSNAPVCLLQKLVVEVTNKPPFPHRTQWYNNYDVYMGYGDSLVLNPIKEHHGQSFYARFIATDSSYCNGDTAQTPYMLKEYPSKPMLLGNLEVCSGDTLKIVNFSWHAEDVEYEWTGPSGLTSNAFRELVIPNVNDSVSGYFFLQLQNGNGCKSEIDTIQVVILNYPDTTFIEITSNAPVCENDTLFISAFSPETDIEFSWESPDFSVFTEKEIVRPSAKGGMSGMYFLSIARGLCRLQNIASIKAPVYPYAIANFIWSSIPPITNELVTFSNLSINALNYFWEFSDGFESSIISPEYYFTEENRFWIRLTAFSQDSLCNDSLLKSIDVYNKEVGLYVPSAFSPNGDKINDVFKIFSSGVGFDIKIEIFNRWGEKLFSTNDARNQSWDGTYMGSDCKEDIYMYAIEYKDRYGNNKTKRGTVHLVR
jgi:gliding motility-associated-like protein